MVTDKNNKKHTFKLEITPHKSTSEPCNPVRGKESGLDWVAVPPSRANDGSWCQNQGSSGKTLRKACRKGPVDGQKALGLVEIGPGGVENWALLSGEGASTPPFGQMKESGVVSEAPAAKRCKWGAG